jgi:DNA invertase Pin-like site-specific DNA recombinase
MLFQVSTLPLVTGSLYLGLPVRAKGTTKAKPARVRALRARGLDVAEIVNALKVSLRTVFRYLAEGTTSGQVP